MLCLLLLLPLAIASPILKDLNEYSITIDGETLKSVVPTAKSQNVLDLSGLRLRTIERKAFDNLSNLKSLNLANNALAKLPEFLFSNLSTLENLDLSANNLMRLDNLFVGLDNLKVLNISSNPVRYIYGSDLFGVPKTADVLVEDNRLFTIFRYAFSSDFLKADDAGEIHTLPEVTRVDEKEVNVVHDDELTASESKIDVYKNQRIKICISNHVMKSLEVFSGNENLGEECTEAKFLGRIELNSLGITSFEKGWYKLQSSPFHVIDLSNNSISEISKELLNDLPSDATYVNLAKNNIKHVQKDVIENEHLKELNLGQNPIESIEHSAFSKTKLTGLYFTDTRLKSIDFVPSLPSSLNVLSISGSQVETIPEGAFAHFPNLAYLNLQDNGIKNIEKGAFRGLNSLNQLELTGNKIKEIQSGAFNNMKKIRFLSLSNNLIETVEKGAFSGMDNLERVDLMKNKISKINNGMFTDLPKNLLDLDLSNNEIESIENDSFAGNLSQMLSLARNKLSSIAKNAFNLPHLIILNLSENRIEEIDADSYDGFARLRQLHLNKNKIAHIRKGDASNFGTLFTLNLSENPFERLENGALHGLLLSKGTVVSISDNKLKVIQGGVFEDV